MTLYISDVDGTLLQSSGTVSSRTVEILTELIRRGLHFTVATARTPLSALPLLAEIPIRDPMILMNGALLYDPENRAFSEWVSIPKTSMEILARAEATSGMEGMLFCVEDGVLSVSLGNVKDCMWNGYFAMEKVAYVEAIQQEIRRCSAADMIHTDVIYGLYMDNAPAKLDVLYEQLKDSGLTVDYYKDKYTKDRWCIEICSKAATKGGAVERLRRKGYSQLIGFGDSWNDVPLFQACDESYAVANASDNLKQLATDVIGSNVEDGVAIYLRNHNRA